MKCPACQKIIPDDTDICGWCGTCIIFCPSCHAPNASTANYCTECGLSLKSAGDNPVNPEDDFSYTTTVPQAHETGPYSDIWQDGAELTHPVKTKKAPKTKVPMDEVDTSVNWKKVILAGVLVLAVTVASVCFYTFTTPIPLTSESTAGESGGSAASSGAAFTATANTETAIRSNLIGGGKAASDDSGVYMISDNATLVKMDLDFSNATELYTPTVTGYINLQGDYVYFTDGDSKLLRIKKDGSETKATTILTDKCYYVVVTDNKIYYQNDTDSESLHCADLDGSNDTQLVNDHVYNINVVGDKIYYTTESAVCVYDTETNKSDTLAESKAYSLIYMDGYVYGVTSAYTIFRINVETKSAETILQQAATRLALSDQALYFYGSSAMYRIDLSTKSAEEVFEGTLTNSDFQLIGDNLLANTSDGWYQVNTSDGNSAKVFE